MDWNDLKKHFESSVSYEMNNLIHEYRKNGILKIPTQDEQEEITITGSADGYIEIRFRENRIKVNPYYSDFLVAAIIVVGYDEIEKNRRRNRFTIR